MRLLAFRKRLNNVIKKGAVASDRGAVHLSTQIGHLLKLCTPIGYMRGMTLFS